MYRFRAVASSSSGQIVKIHSQRTLEKVLREQSGLVMKVGARQKIVLKGHPARADSGLWLAVALAEYVFTGNEP